MTVAEKNFKAIFNLKDSTFQFLVRKILAPPRPLLYLTNCPQILFLYLAIKKYFIDIHKLAHFQNSRNSKIVRQQYRFQSFKIQERQTKLMKFCYQQIWTPLLQNKDIEMFTKKK